MESSHKWKVDKCMACNIKIVARPGEHPERLIRRFVKKVKKKGILEKYRERTSYYIKPSERRRIKRQRAINQRKKNEDKIQQKR